MGEATVRRNIASTLADRLPTRGCRLITVLIASLGSMAVVVLTSLRAVSERNAFFMALVCI
jgi:hypothetical protein